MIESDDNFEPLATGYDYMVDFLDLSFPTTRPDRDHCYVEVSSCRRSRATNKWINDNSK